MQAALEASDVLLLDIEGTICSISFVKDKLYPYFIQTYPDFLTELEFPLRKVDEHTDADAINNIVLQFPDPSSKQAICLHISDLVAKDIKDPILKAFQGYVWKLGYEKGDIVAPLYPDAIEVIRSFSRHKKVYIYSSGSVKAQKLLFKYVKDGESVVDLNPLLSGYFDITTSGFKQEAKSYKSISESIGYSGKESKILFLSDNVNEIKAARDAGLQALLVDRPGNNPVSEDDASKYNMVTSFV